MIYTAGSLMDFLAKNAKTFDMAFIYNEFLLGKKLLEGYGSVFLKTFSNHFYL